jgi:HlyD family secretion protein
LVAPGTRIATVEIDHPDEPLMSLAYFKNSDGKRIQTGDRILVTPSNVERERVGSIVGTVLAGSRFPVTRQGAVNDVGSEEIVNALMSGGGAIEVLARLEPHPQNPARFKWTSPGPDMDFTAGTTTTVRVIVEQRRPISYVLPLLKTWIFADKDDRVPPF